MISMRRRKAVEPATEIAELFEPTEAADSAETVDPAEVVESVHAEAAAPAESVAPDAVSAFIDADNHDTVPVTVVTDEVMAEVAEADVAAEVPAESVVPVEPDPVLLAARDQARAALEEITDADSIGEDEGHEAHEAHVLTLFFACTHPGYPGWRWAATLARVDEHSDVNVLEVELLPGPGSLTAPAWLPWSERLAQYHDAQALQAEPDLDEDDEDDEDDPDSDILVNDFSDFDDEIDGVEVDGDDVEGETDDEEEDSSDVSGDDEADSDTDDEE